MSDSGVYFDSAQVGAMKVALSQAQAALAAGNYDNVISNLKPIALHKSMSRVLRL